MEIEKPLNLRHGHRERVRRQAMTESVENWEDYRILELLLFYSIPQKDVKELAHLLVRTFGNLESVLNADEEALCRVPGVGKKTAELFRCFREAMEVKPRSDTPQSFQRAKDITDYFSRYYAESETREPRLLLLNNRYESVGNVPLALSPIGSLSPKEVMLAVLRYNAAAIVIAIPTKRTILSPAPDQLQSITEVQRTMEDIGACLLECVIIGQKRSAFVLAQTLGEGILAQRKLFLKYD